VRTQDIDWIEAAADNVKLHVGKETHVFRETMNALETKLDPALFLRIHRSTIVNLNRRREVHRGSTARSPSFSPTARGSPSEAPTGAD